ncbi:MAG: response regulator transcription factor [Verrucomicrobiota bacterium]
MAPSRCEDFQMRVLLVEDDRKSANFLAKALRAEGFAVDHLDNGDDALAAVSGTPFDAVLLDIMLKGRDGLSVLKQMRAQENRTPVLLLSARGAVNERVEGLNAGADDYLPKPYALDEVIARLRALLRRGGDSRPAVLQAGDLSLDTTTRIATRGGRRMELTAREFRLLEYLMRSAGRVCSRMMILEKVWDYSFDPGSNIVDVYVGKLREKIDAGATQKLIHSVRGEGYVVREDA